LRRRNDLIQILTHGVPSVLAVGTRGMGLARAQIMSLAQGSLTYCQLWGGNHTSSKRLVKFEGFPNLKDFPRKRVHCLGWCHILIPSKVWCGVVEYYLYGIARISSVQIFRLQTSKWATEKD